MQLETFYSDQEKGWSVAAFPALDSERTLILLFADPKFNKFANPIEEIMGTYKKSHIIGCSTAGEIYQKNVFNNRLIIAVVKFEHTDIRVAHAFIDDQSDSFKAGAQLISSLSQTPNLSHIFLLSDGTNVNGTELVKSVLDAAPKNVMVTGGLAGDGARFERTWTLCNEQGIQEKMIVAVRLYGDRVNVSYGSEGGWDTFGPERIITRDEKNQSLTFAGDMPEGWRAQLMTANFERLIEGASKAGTLAKIKQIQRKESPMLTIAISCIGRRLVLGERVEEELDAVLEMFPPYTQQLGFYSYGEISPSGLSNCDLHNQTMTLTVLTEE